MAYNVDVDSCDCRRTSALKAIQDVEKCSIAMGLIDSMNEQV